MPAQLAIQVKWQLLMSTENCHINVITQIKQGSHSVRFRYLSCDVGAACMHMMLCTLPAADDSIVKLSAPHTNVRACNFLLLLLVIDPPKGRDDRRPALRSRDLSFRHTPKPLLSCTFKLKLSNFQLVWSQRIYVITEQACWEALGQP